MSRPNPRNPTPGRSRRLAEAFGAYARRIAPVARRDWADAMGAEIASIDPPRAALAFALGCVWASCRQRLADPATLVGLARSGVAGATAVLAALVWRLAVKLLSGGPDAAWATTALIGLGVLYLTAAWTLARRRPRSFALSVTAALSLDTLAMLALRGGATGESGPARFYHALVSETYGMVSMLAAAGLALWWLDGRVRRRRESVSGGGR